MQRKAMHCNALRSTGSDGSAKSFAFDLAGGPENQLNKCVIKTPKNDNNLWCSNPDLAKFSSSGVAFTGYLQVLADHI